MSAARYRILVAVYCMVILLVSSIPGRNLVHLKLEGWDKVLHLLEYLILGWLLHNALERRSPKLVTIVFAGGAIFGGIDEMWQMMVSGRDPSVFDWLADTGGILLGLMAGQAWFQVRNKS